MTKKILAGFVLGIAMIIGIPTALAGLAKAETFTICPSGLTGVATADTSCAFADNVRAAWYTQPGTTVIAYSPVTQLFYTMQCYWNATDTWYNSKRCFGVNAFGAVLIVFIA